MTIKHNGLFIRERQPDALIGGAIAVFENVWPDPHNTINLIEEQVSDLNSGVFWERAGTIGLGPFQKARTNKLMNITGLAEISDNQILQNVNNIFYTALLSTSIPYAIGMGIAEPLFHEGYQLLKYTGGEEYKAHYDGGTNIGRSISALCYLNDDYEGGEIEFVNYKIKIKPEPGMLILFPSNYAYMHIAHPVTSGTKYALVTWIRDREML